MAGHAQLTTLRVLAVSAILVMAWVGQAHAERYSDGSVPLSAEPLSAPLTLDLAEEAVPDLLAKVQEATGVRLAARGMENDKVSVFVDALPARDLLVQVARLFDCRWQGLARGGYVLAPPANRDSLRTDASARYRAGQETRYRRLVTDAIAHLNDNDKQLKALAVRDPELALNLVANRYSYDMLSRLTPGELEEFFNNGKPIIPLSRLSSEVQERTRESVRRIEREHPSAHITSDRLEQTGYQIFRNGEWGMAGTSITIWQPDSTIFTGSVGYYPEWTMDGYWGPQEDAAADKLGIDREELVKFQWQRRVPHDGPNQAFAHAMPQVVEMMPIPSDIARGASLADIERWIHEHYGVPVVADCYCRFWPKLRYGQSVPASPEMFLDVVALDFDYAWVRDGSVIRMRNPLWFESDAKEAPTSVFKELAARVKGHGRLLLEDELWLVEHGKREWLDPLYDSRYKGLHFPNAMWLDEYWEILRVYALLPPEQKERCWETGLAVAEMSAAMQAQVAQCVVESRHLDQGQLPDVSSATLTARIEHRDGLGDIEGAEYYSLDVFHLALSGLMPDPSGGRTSVEARLHLTKDWSAKVRAALP